ncbi:phosphatases II [Daedalea quercina L-15889]|uniref:protein-tyrosine-phosphatase n=1 Tax=Daedalea quercina L-15889 TaxID=1314783 RepID=A0A165UBS1_9APHY|nr:phosphatases II [Daedalea quercina L-15889]
MKKLSLTLPSAQSSTNSLLSTDGQGAEPKRRLSIVSLPAPVPATSLRRRGEEDQSLDSASYHDGPVQILPSIWLGSEDNVRDWRGLRERGIRSILNVAKEVSTVFDTVKPHRAFMSTPDLGITGADSESTYYFAHVPSGRPAMHYLKLPWSHGQADLVHTGFPAAFAFVDRALERGDGVLIHCQCGVSRSATLAIALVMRAAAQRSPNVPCEVWALKGMQGAYDFVKEKSNAIGPNMSLIYQLLDYERTFKTGTSSPALSDQSPSEAEWSRQRMLMDEGPTDDDKESVEVMREARALDQAMENRLMTRKSSVSSMSSSGSCPRRPRLASRKRAGSIASVMTGSSLLSENLVEEDEEQELLGVGGGFDESSEGTCCSSAEPTEDEGSRSRKDSGDSEQPSSGFLTARQVPAARMPPSAPHHKSSFTLPPPPATAIRASFDLTPRPLRVRARKPPNLAILPPVPSSPIIPVNSPPSPPPVNVRRLRADARKPTLPPKDLRIKVQNPSRPKLTSAVSTPSSQMLFVFPPSPTATRTPSTMTLTSNASFPFPPLATPRVSSFKADGRRRSFIGVPPPSTPTVASSRVDARGWIGGLGK